MSDIEPTQTEIVLNGLKQGLHLPYKHIISVIEQQAADIKRLEWLLDGEKEAKYQYRQELNELRRNPFQMPEGYIAYPQSEIEKLLSMQPSPAIVIQLKETGLKEFLARTEVTLTEDKDQL